RLHHRQEVVVVCDVDRRFGREYEGKTMRFLPSPEVRQKGTNGFLIADEVVVDEVDVPAIAELVESLQLRQHLRRRFRTGNAPVELDDVAELAGKRAAAGKLHADVKIVV